MKRYRLLKKKGEGTFSEVLAAQHVKTGELVAIKCMKSTFQSIEQVNNLREIQALRRLSPHPNIVNLREVLYDKPTGRLALVFELLVSGILLQCRSEALWFLVGAAQAPGRHRSHGCGGTRLRLASCL